MRVIRLLWDSTEAYRAIYYNSPEERRASIDAHDRILDGAREAATPTASSRELDAHRERALDGAARDLGGARVDAGVVASGAVSRGWRGGPKRNQRRRCVACRHEGAVGSPPTPGFAAPHHHQRSRSYATAPAPAPAASGGVRRRRKDTTNATTSSSPARASTPFQWSIVHAVPASGPAIEDPA